MSERCTWRTAALALAGLAAACGGDITPAGAGGDGPTGPRADVGFKSCALPCTAPQVCSKAGVCIDPGTCAHDGDCADPTQACDTSKGQCVLAAQCGTQELQVSAVSSDLLVVLDRSCSMKKTIGEKTKFEIAVAALATLLAGSGGKIHFGLSLFPDITGDKCTQDEVQVPIASGTEGKIQKLLTAALAPADQLYPDGPCVTNIDTAMQQAAEELARADKSRGRYALLITDGKQAGCDLAGGDAGTTKIITQLRQQGIQTFVVGFGAEVDPAQLNVFADAGGKPNADPALRFYKAEDQASLEAALAKIGGQAFGCVLKLQQVPADLSKVYVYFDDREIPEDATRKDGWVYDPAQQTLQFFGAACAALEGGKVADLDIVYGCNKPVDAPGCPGDQVACGGTGAGQCPAEHACVSGCCMPIVD
jgi:hypothetical protein